MKKSILKTNFLLNLINSSLIKLPTPLNISIWWNFGFLLSFNLLMQIITGFILTMHYNSNINDAFNSVIHIIQDVNYGWLIRLMHMNGASLFFIFLFIHIGRGMYYNSFTLKKTWIIGVIIFFLVMATAFLGYVLPWGQMSFWGATVITNLISAIPYIGDMTVKWLWGGFSVNYATLSRFYSFHFILPLIVLIFVMLHLLFLHETGSTNPLGLNSNYFKIPFNPYYSLKDILGLIIVMMLFMFICMYNPYMFSDSENFNPANPMITPVHIQPEWYFLFAYAILRSIPNKLGGVIALLMSILILLIMPFTMNYNIKGFKFNYLNQLNYWMFISYFIILTFIGARPVEDPYIIIGQLVSILYFSYFFTYLILSNILEKILFKQ